MTQVNTVVRRIEYQFMEADYVALTKRSDFRRRICYLANDVPEHERRAGRRIPLLFVMPLENLRKIPVFDGLRSLTRRFQKDVQPDGKVGRIQEAGACGFDIPAHLNERFVPPG